MELPEALEILFSLKNKKSYTFSPMGLRERKLCDPS